MNYLLQWHGTIGQPQWTYEFYQTSDQMACDVASAYAKLLAPLRDAPELLLWYGDKLVATFKTSTMIYVTMTQQ